MLHINGRNITFNAISVADYLTQHGYQLTLVAVEQNGSILPRSAYKNTILADGDTLEIVSFVGGG